MPRAQQQRDRWHVRGTHERGGERARVCKVASNYRNCADRTRAGPDGTCTARGPCRTVVEGLVLLQLLLGLLPEGGQRALGGGGVHVDAQGVDWGAGGVRGWSE